MEKNTFDNIIIRVNIKAEECPRVRVKFRIMSEVSFSLFGNLFCTSCRKIQIFRKKRITLTLRLNQGVPVKEVRYVCTTCDHRESRWVPCSMWRVVTSNQCPLREFEPNEEH